MVPMELVLVIDGSSSIGPTDFLVQLQFLKDLVADLDISPTGTRVAMTQFSTVPRVEFGFIDNKTELDAALAAVEYKRGSTYTAHAMQYSYSAFKNCGPAPKFGHFLGFLSEIFGQKNGFYKTPK